MSGTRRIGVPTQVTVRTGSDGRPLTVGGLVVNAVRETWLLEDRWWTERPLRRRYWELITTDGRNLVIFHDIIGRRWWRQR